MGQTLESVNHRQVIGAVSKVGMGNKMRVSLSQTFGVRDEMER